MPAPASMAAIGNRPFDVFVFVSIFTSALSLGRGVGTVEDDDFEAECRRRTACIDRWWLPGIIQLLETWTRVLCAWRNSSTASSKRLGCCTDMATVVMVIGVAALSLGRRHCQSMCIKSSGAHKT